MKRLRSFLNLSSSTVARKMAISLVFASLSSSVVMAQDQSSPQAPVPKDAPRLENADCVTDALKAMQAECYTFFGQEDWSDPNGRLVELPVAVIAPKQEGNPDAPPVVFFPGGPGYSVIGNRDYIEQLRKDIGNRTLIVMDHRGFIHAKPTLACPDYAEVSPYHNIIHTPAITSSLDPMERMDAITGEVAACYNKLESEGIDVAEYNQYAVSRDVDEIRRLLGYDTIDAFGSSTGSGTVLSYLQYHPENVRAAILGWPWFTSLRNRSPLDEFYVAKQTFSDVLALCTANSERCREQLPAWFLAIDRARRTLDDRPYVATVQDEGKDKRLYFDGAAFLDTLYLMLPSDYAQLPRLVNEIQAGDYSSLSEFFRIDQYQSNTQAPNYALGYFLAHVCNDMGTNRPTPMDSRAAIQREPGILGFEPPWLCAWWGVDGDVPSSHSDPLQSDKPALSIHGQMDPCCGTRWGEVLSRTMPNLQTIEIQAKGHSPVTECRSKVISAFLDDPMARIDTSCADEVPLEPWALQ